jgi:hypothetical protein
MLNVKTHLTGAGIRKREGFSTVNLLFVFTPRFRLISTLLPMLSIILSCYRGAKHESLISLIVVIGTLSKSNTLK